MPRVTGTVFSRQVARPSLLRIWSALTVVRLEVRTQGFKGAFLAIPDPLTPPAPEPDDHPRSIIVAEVQARVDILAAADRLKSASQ
jgi:hypothetical protein